MDKKIKYVDIVLENCECVRVPFECFDKFTLNQGEEFENEQAMQHLEFLIKDNGKVDYSFGFETTMTPIQRLGQYNDVAQIHIYYEDGSDKMAYIDWNDYNPNTNKNQETKLIDYKTIHIQIQPYIEKYFLYQLFAFDIGTRFKDQDGNIYELKENSNGKFVDGVKPYEKYIKMKYIFL